MLELCCYHSLVERLSGFSLDSDDRIDSAAKHRTDQYYCHHKGLAACYRRKRGDSLLPVYWRWRQNL
jgi:hypothetical protein